MLYFRHMQKRNLKTFFGGPAQSADAYREALRMIEDDCLTDDATARNLSLFEKEIRHANISAQEDLRRVHQ